MNNKRDFYVEEGNFTVIENDIFRAELDGLKITPESWGVYCFFLSLPKDWDYTITGLTKVINAGKNKIQRILKELENAGLIKRFQENKNGVFGKMNYIILRSISTKKEDIEEPYPQNPPTVKPSDGNEPQQSIKEQRYIDKDKIKGENTPKYHFLTLELINKKIVDYFDYDIDKYNSLFFDLDRNYGYEIVLDATRYSVDAYLKNKKNVNNIYAYLETAILNNVHKLDTKDSKAINWSKSFRSLSSGENKNLN